MGLHGPGLVPKDNNTHIQIVDTSLLIFISQIARSQCIKNKADNLQNGFDLFMLGSQYLLQSHRI